MNLPSAATLAADPVFQLNAILWSLIPSRGGDYHAVLEEQGYFLHSIGRRLQISGETREQLASAVGRGSPSPDVLVDHASDSTMLTVECKASSFGTESSTSLQAQKLLVGSSDMADTVGASHPRPAYLIYATRSGEDDQMWETLEGLKKALSEQGLPTADAGIVVVDIRDGGVWLGLGQGDPPPKPLSAALRAPAMVIAFEEGDHPLPLYIVPWDPGVEQDAHLAELGKALLAARVLNEATSTLGRAVVPGSVTLSASSLLDAATFGVSSTWRARSDVDRLESLIVNRLLKPIRGLPEVTATSTKSPYAVQVVVKSEDQRSAIISALEQVDEWSALEGPEQTELNLI